MPEIKNTFSQGKMEKDLDERLIPKGQYRDALNISVITSEGSDVGTAQNIMGNSPVSTLSHGGKCVGSIANEITNKLYSFVKMQDRDVIVEFDKGAVSLDDSSIFIAVDRWRLFGHEDYVGLEPFLKFTGKQITGINIIDDFLFWTDGDSEPKKINISQAPHLTNPTSIDLHSRLYVDGQDKGYLTEDHVTVVKKKPSIAPTYEMHSSVGSVGSAIFEKIFPRFCFRYKYRDGEYSAMGPFTDVVFNAEYDDGISSLNSYNVDEPYNKAMTNVIKSIDLYDFIPSDIPKDVVQVDILYKQENSSVVYSIANIGYTDAEWKENGSGQLADTSDYTEFSQVSNHKGKYSILTESIHAALPESQLLRPWDNVPRSALAQEVVGNRVVYGNYTQGYDFGKTSDGDLIKPKVVSGYELRENQDFYEGGLRSLKSKRDYQVGVVFGDKYGRETPVFAAKKGVKIDWNHPVLGQNASNSNMFKAYVDIESADWIDYYKFYIKQSSGEYYNLIMEKVYLPPKHVDFHNDNDHIWLSFASSDRNKVIEDDFLIAKKIFDGSNLTQPLFDNKYKILDISNEAPEAIKYTFSSLGIVNNATADGLLAGYLFDSNGNVTTGDDGSVFSNPLLRIDKQVQDIEITKRGWLSTLAQGSDLMLDFGATGSNDLFMSWENNGNHSKRYRVSSVRSVPVIPGADALEGIYIIKLSSVISADDASIAENTNDWELNDDLVFKIERRDEKPGEEFSGKFFVKTKDNPDLLTFEDSSLENQLFVSTSQKMYWLYSSHSSPGNGDETGGLVNAIDPGAPSDYPIEIVPSSTPDQWSTLVAGNENGFFIDNLPFVSSNPSFNSYAKEAGEGWFGAQTRYEDYSWAEKIGPWVGVSYEIYDVFNLDVNLAEYLYEWQGPLFGMDVNLFQDTSAQSGGDFQYVTGFTDPNEHPWDSGNWDNYRTRQMNYYTWDIPKTAGGRGLAPVVYLSEEEPGNRIVNGLEGIMTSTISHTNGIRRWLTSSGIHDEFSTDNTYGRPNDPGRHFMHLSFLAPGVDLISLQNTDENTDPIRDMGVDLVGYNSIAKHLQGIWGGGVFTLTPDSSILPSSEGDWASAFANTNDYSVGGIGPSPFGDDAYGDGISIMEFEGNYDPQTKRGRENAPSLEQGQGYDLNYKNKHENQWNAFYRNNAANAIDADILSFTQKILVGSSFRFKDDTSETIYKIKSVRVKHLYNHTSWRMRWIFDGIDYKKASDVGYPLSVEEAASEWANSVTVDDDHMIINSDAGKGHQLKSALENFGAAHNRRTCYIIELDKSPIDSGYNPGAQDGSSVDQNTSTNIEFVTQYPTMLTEVIQNHPTIWETEPQQLADLNIYYEASNNIPTKLTSNSAEIFAPIGCRVVVVSGGLEQEIQDINADGRIPGQQGVYDYNANRRITEWEVSGAIAKFQLNNELPLVGSNNEYVDYSGAIVKFIRENGSYTTGRLIGIESTEGPILTKYLMKSEIDTSLDTGLSWYNCFSFGDGVESNRIRDTFNEMQLANGAKASSTLEEPYTEEHRKHGLIYSGIYNSNSSVNNLNQFIQAEKITKDLNPTYGSIQKLFTRSTDLVALCEDRVLKVLANKDALFNADGNPQLVASSNVLGQAVPFVGDFGISKNPESFASESYRAYFTDKQRGSVLRLSMDGLTPISDAGMRDWFRDNLNNYSIVTGSYDDHNKEYNVTLNNNPVDTSNLINNSGFDFGLPSTEFSNDESILVNSAPITGTPFLSNYSLAEIWNLSQLGQTQGLGSFAELLVPLKNMSLDSTTQIKHWPEIPKGHFVFGQEGQEGIQDEFGIFDISTPEEGAYDSALKIYSADLGFGSPFSVLSNIFDTAVGAGSPLAYATRFMTDSSGVETTYDLSTSGPPATNLFLGTGAIWKQDADTNPVGGIVFAPSRDLGSYENPTPSISKYSVKIPANFAYENAPGAEIAGFGALIVHPDVLEEFPEAKNNTIFNGEEVIVYFKSGIFNITDPSQIGIPFNMSVELYDGEDLVDSSIILSNPEYATETTSNPYTSVHYQNNQWGGYGDGSPHPYDYHMGWSGSNQVPFRTIWTNVGDWPNASPTNPIHGEPNLNSVAFKFSDGTINDSVLVNDLIVKLSLVTDDNALLENYHVYVDEFRLVKPHRLIAPTGVEGQDFIPAMDPIPFDAIPPWAEVIHGSGVSIPGWTGLMQSTGENDFVNFIYGNETIYGLQNEGQLITEVDETGISHQYYSGTSNGVTNFGDNIDTLPGPPLPGESGDPVIVNVEVRGGNSVTSVQCITENAIGHITQDISSTPLEQDHWYIVDVELQASTANPNIVIPGAIYSSLASAANGLNQDSGDPNYPQGYFGEINFTDLKLMSTLRTEYDNLDSNQGGVEVFRGVFKYVTNSNLSADTFRIQCSNSNFKINSIVLIDITSTATGGKPDSWYTPPSNYLDGEYTLLDQPEVYFDNSGGAPRIEWNTTQSSDKYIDQQFDQYVQVGNEYQNPNPSPETTADGWSLGFTVTPLSNLGIQGSLSGYIAGAPDSSGQYEGFGFKNLTEPGEYVLTGNFDGVSPIYVAQYGVGIIDSVEAGTINSLFGLGGSIGAEALQDALQNAKKIRFLPGSDGFTGSIKDITLRDRTNYFTGGTVGLWNIVGFDQTTENFISWAEPGVIAFESSPSNVNINQNIGDIPTGQEVRLAFDYKILTGSVSGYYYNSENKGFKFDTIGLQTGEELSYERDFVVGSETLLGNPAGILLNTVVITTADGLPMTGSIDNISLNKIFRLSEPTTVSYSEDVKGWVSFKSFIPDSGVSLSNQYFTIKRGDVYQHDINETRNMFYKRLYESSITTILNDSPSSVKSFNTINYEGSQAAIKAYSHEGKPGPDGGVTTLSTYNAFVNDKLGWEMESFETDLQKGFVDEFIKKENKWFNYIKGLKFVTEDIDTSMFNFQGLGIVSSTY